MNRNFAILGVREDATKDQVKAAYELRMKKYKSSDYDDDQDYVRRKIAQLKEAYEAAYSVAGTEDAYSRNDFDRKEELKAAPYRTKNYETKKHNHDKFERDRDRASQRGEDHRFKKPDLSKLKGKMESMKDRVSEGMSQIAEEIHEGQEIRDIDEGSEQRVPRPHNGIHRLDDRNSGEACNRTPQPVSMPTLDGSGSGKVIDTPSGAGAPVSDSNDDSVSMGGGSVAGMLIAILIAFVMMFASMCEDGPEPGNDYYSGDYGYSYEYVDPADQAIYDTAMETNFLLDQQGMADSYDVHSFSDQDLTKAGDRFVKNYFKADSLEEVRAYLYDTYGEFAVESEESYEYQITEVLNFYGFKSIEEVEGLIGPYTEKPMGNLVQYLRYLNTYYKKNGLVQDEIE